MRKMIVAALGVILLAASVLAETTYRYEDDVRNPAGVVVSSATVTVYVADTTTEATLYSGIDTALGTRANPVYTDSAGRYWFYALPGRYDIKVERSGYVTYTREDVVVGASGSGTGSDWPSIEDYGAGADDSTDDTDAINSAIVAANAAGGGKILVPKGDFYVNRDGEDSSSDQYGVVLLDNVTLVGEPGARIVVPAQQGGTATPLPVAYAIYASEAYNIGLQDIEIVFESGQPSGATHEIAGVKLESCGNVTLDNVSVSGIPYAGIYVESQHEDYEYSWVTIRDCKASGAGGYARGILVESVQGGLEISGCEISSVGNSGISLTGCRSPRIGMNEIYSPGRDGIEMVNVTKPNIVGNTVTAFERYGISAYASGTSRPSTVSIVGNHLTGANNSGDAGIYIESPKSATITGNTIITANWDGINAAASVGGIIIYQSGVNPAEDVTIVGNTIENIDPDYAGGLYRRPFAIAVRGQGEPIRGITIGDNTIENCYGGVYSRPTGARSAGAWTIRNVTTAVDTTFTADTTAPTMSDSTMAAVEDGDSGNVVISWSAASSEQARATARWRINSDDTWNTEAATALGLLHSDVIYTPDDAVQDDSVFVDVKLVDQVGNDSGWIDLGVAVIDTIAADPTDTTAPNITSGDVTYQISGGVIVLSTYATTDEDDGAIRQFRHRVNDGSWVNGSWNTTYSNLHTETITTTRAPTDGDEFDVYMRAEDQSSNMSAWTAVDSVTVSLIDDTAPTVTAVSVSAYDDDGVASVFYSFTTDEGAIHDVRWSRNGGAWTEITGLTFIYQTSHSATIYTTVPSADGDIYAVEVRAEDEYGNRSAWTAIGSDTLNLAAAGDPTIEYVSSNSGTFSNGVTITISGENFGDDAGSDTPLLWDDFESGSVGQTIESAGYWTQRVTGDFIEPVFSDEHSRSLSRPQVCKFWSNGLQDYLVKGELNGVRDTGKYFFSVWMRMKQAPAEQVEAVQYKCWRLMTNNGTSDGYSNLPGPYWYYKKETGSGTSLTSNSPNGNSVYTDYGLSGTEPNNIWHLYQIQVDEGDVGVANATLKIYQNGADVTRNAESQTGFEFLNPDYGATGPVKQVLLGHTVVNVDIAPEEDSIIDWHYDDVYFSNTWRRVELGNNAVYGNCTVREMQPTLSWSQNVVTAEFNPGSFGSGDTAYLFVVDDDGTASAGEAITIGGASQDVQPSATVTFSVSADQDDEAIILADTRPGGANVDSDMTAQWRYKDSQVWSPANFDTWYELTYRPEPYVQQNIGIFYDATPDTIIVRAKLKSEAGLESVTYTSGDLVIFDAGSSDIPTVLDENISLSLSGSSEIVASGLILPSVEASAFIQSKKNSGSWAPADTTVSGDWTSIGSPNDPIDVNFNSNQTVAAGDTVYFRVTLRNAAGTEHMGSWYTLPSYIEPGATSKRWLFAFEQANNYAEASLDTADFDVVVYNQSVEGVLDAARPTTGHSQPSGSNTWENDMDYGGALPWSSDGSFYMWYPGAVGDSISGKTVTEATLYIQPYNSSNDLTGSGEGVVCVALTGGTYEDWAFPTRTSWDFSWAYSEVSTTTTWVSGGAPAWSTVPSFSAMGDTLVVQENFVAATVSSLDVTSLLQAVADEVGGGGDFLGFLFTIKSLDGGGTRLTFLTGDGGSTDNHPVLTITTED